MRKAFPDGPQLLVHTVSGLYITPQGNVDSDSEVRLWRQGGYVTSVKTAQWELHAVNGGDSLVRIKNAQFDRCLTLAAGHDGALVVQQPWDEHSNAQVWNLFVPNEDQADFLIASSGEPNLVISPRESHHGHEVALEVEEKGPWADQFWRWRQARG